MMVKMMLLVVMMVIVMRVMLVIGDGNAPEGAVGNDDGDKGKGDAGD